jgi:tRNA (cmo5U34)-methyltransferase
MGNQWHFDPPGYLRLVRSEIPEYDRLQDALAEATSAVPAETILDLGSGTGVTAQRVLARHPDGSLVGVDASDDMLVHARRLLPDAKFLVGDLAGRLPAGPFDLVVSAFAIHHLDAAGKAALFRQVASVLAPGGRFVFLDVVVPTTDVARPVPLEAGVDLPSSVDDQLGWLAAAGLHPAVVLAEDDLAIIAADRPGN